MEFRFKQNIPEPCVDYRNTTTG